MKKIFIVLVVLALGYFAYTKLGPAGNNNLIFDDGGNSGGGSSSGGSGTTQTTYTPTEVVTMFTRATLGGIPGSLVDYDLAKTLIGSEMASDWEDAGNSYVPLTYGIQQGPDTVEMVDEQIEGDHATVEVQGYWGGEVQKAWYFELDKSGSEWIITKLTPEDLDLYY